MLILRIFVNHIRSGVILNSYSWQFAVGNWQGKFIANCHLPTANLKF